MSTSAPMPYERDDQDSATLKWVILFVVLSIAAHVLLLLTLIILSKHIPAPRLEPTAVAPTTTITMIQPPPPVPKPIFLPTHAQKNVPHKQTQVESDNDTKLSSESKTARNPNSIMPDIVSKDSHSSSMDSSPSAPPTKAKDSQTTPPAPKADQAKPQPPTPPQPPQPNPAKDDPTKTPPQPTKVTPPPKPTPAPPPKTPPPQVDENGLPVLPAINAQTLAPRTSATAAQQQVAAPPPSMPMVPMNMQGRAGISGQPSPEAMKTALGSYKARFYAAVGSQWYSKLTPDTMQLIGVGSVCVHYTIYKDGTIKTWVVPTEASNNSMTILLSLSESSIRAVSPFIPFPDAMVKQVGDSYSDYFTFSLY